MEGFTFKLVVEGAEGGALPLPPPSPPEIYSCDVAPAVTDGLYILSYSAHAATLAEAVGHVVDGLLAAGVSVRAVRWTPSLPLSAVASWPALPHDLPA